VINETCLNEDFSAMNSSITKMFLGTVDLAVNIYDQAQVSSDCAITDLARKRSLIKIIFRFIFSLFFFDKKILIIEHVKRDQISGQKFFYNNCFGNVTSSSSGGRVWSPIKQILAIIFLSVRFFLLIKLSTEIGRLSYLNHRMQIGDVNLDVTLMDQQELRCDLAK